MARDEIDISTRLRPRIRGRSASGDQPAPRFRSALLSRLLKASARAQSHSSKASTGRALHADARRCVVKARYVPMDAYGQDAARLHLKYLERDGVERDGSPGELYGRDAGFVRDTFGEPIPGERHQFRFIVSPEDGGEVDLKVYARKLMAQMELELGRPLLWAAVNHHNTDQPHIHIVIRGVDGRGKQLRIPRRYVSFGMRETGERLLTREARSSLGLDRARQRTRDVSAERFTTVDRGLAALAGPDGTVTAAALARASRDERSAYHARLDVLARLGLARRDGRTWHLSADWDGTLKRLGERGDIIKRLHQASPGDLARYRVFDGASTFTAFEGVVRAKGLHDEPRRHALRGGGERGGRDVLCASSRGRR